MSAVGIDSEEVTPTPPPEHQEINDRKPMTVLGIQAGLRTAVPPGMKGFIWMLPSVGARL
jgi:hypothetical protein